MFQGQCSFFKFSVLWFQCQILFSVLNLKALLCKICWVSCKHTFQSWPFLHPGSTGETERAPERSSPDRASLRVNEQYSDCSSVTFEAEINTLTPPHNPSGFYANAAKVRASSWPLLTALLCVCVAPPDLSQRHTRTQTDSRGERRRQHCNLVAAFLQCPDLTLVYAEGCTPLPWG